MTDLEKLYELASQNDISVYDYHMSNTKKAACLHIENCKAITLDRPVIESKIEECELLAEEVGHYVTEGLYVIEATQNTPVARSNRFKYEAGARRWKIERLLPAKKIQKAIRICGSNNLFEIAESCNASVDFLRKALEHYENQSISFQWFEESI